MRVKAEGQVHEIDPKGRSIGDALRSAGLMIDMRCGGHGVCGKCEVVLLKGRFKVKGKARNVSEPLTALACTSFALDAEAEIELPKSSVADEKPQCLEMFQKWLLPQTHAKRKGYGIAIDAGTTTVAVAVVDLATGAVLASDSMFNAQLRFGDTPIARIAHASGNPAQLQQRQKAAVEETATPLRAQACAEAGITPAHISLATVSGNTVMSHLFFGLPPDGMGQLPFAPFTLDYAETPAASLGLTLAPSATAISAPSVSGFIGGDTVSGVIACALGQSQGSFALLDLGTNCETVLSLDGRLTACASAAGPAFEGAGIECGQRASAGAIDKIKIGEGLSFNLSVIGGGKPEGLCGSAMLDFLAEGRKNGLLNEFGRFDMELLRKSGRALTVDGGINACRIDDGGKVHLSERDIEQLLKAKSAIAAGLKTICDELQTKPGEIGNIYLAGGFAQYLDIGNAIAIGMLPDIPREHYVKAGNSSLAGAVRLALDPKAQKEFKKAASSMKTLVLNAVPAFEDNYIDALMLP